MSRSATTLNVVLKLNTPQALIAFLTARSEIPRMYAVDSEALVRSNEMKSQLLETFSAEFCKLLYAYVDDRHPSMIKNKSDIFTPPWSVQEFNSIIAT